MSIGSDDPMTGRARQGPRPEVVDRGTNEGASASSTPDLVDVDGRLDAAVDGVRRRACGLAVALTVDGTTSVVLDEGRDPLTDHTLFEIGSVTKTMTALVLARAVAGGEVTLGTTVGEVLGAAAHRVAPVTLLQLATHTAGLPRLALNHRLDGDDPEDPYARFDEGRLLSALAEVAPAAEPTEYSNFGFQILGYALERTLATPLTQLFQARIFDPLGMTESRCGDFLDGDQRVPGYGREGVVPFWGLRLAGPGGVACSIADLAARSRPCTTRPSRPSAGPSSWPRPYMPPGPRLRRAWRGCSTTGCGATAERRPASIASSPSTGPAGPEWRSP